MIFYSLSQTKSILLLHLHYYLLLNPRILLRRQHDLNKLMMILKLLKLLLFELLKLLIHLILLLDHLDDVVDLCLVQDLMHGCVPEVPEQER